MFSYWKKTTRTGGLISTFKSEGFFFDTGPRAYVNSGIVKPILSDLGIHWEFLKIQFRLASKTSYSELIR